MEYNLTQNIKEMINSNNNIIKRLIDSIFPNNVFYDNQYWSRQHPLNLISFLHKKRILENKDLDYNIQKQKYEFFFYHIRKILN